MQRRCNQDVTRLDGPGCNRRSSYKALVFKPKLAKRYRLHHNSTSQITEHNNHFYKTIGGNLSLFWNINYFQKLHRWITASYRLITVWRLNTIMTWQISLRSINQQVVYGLKKLRLRINDFYIGFSHFCQRKQNNWITINYLFTSDKMTFGFLAIFLSVLWIVLHLI